MKTKRLISLLLVIVMLVCALTSCSTSPQAIVEKADKALADTPYKLDVDMDLEADDKYLEMLSALDIKQTIYMDGTNFETTLDLGALIPGVEGVDMKTTLTHYDSVAYLNVSVFGFPIKNKAQLESVDVEELLGSVGMMDIGALDFDSLAIEKEGDAGLVVKCTNIKADKLTEFSKEIGGEDFSIENVNLDATIVDGKYKNITVSMVYKFDVSGEKFDVDAKMTMDFDYENAKEITAPADKDQYNEVNFDKLFDMGF